MALLLVLAVVVLKLQVEKGAAARAVMEHRAQTDPACVVIAHLATAPIHAAALTHLGTHFVLRVVVLRPGIYRPSTESHAVEVEVEGITPVPVVAVPMDVMAGLGWWYWPGVLHRRLHMPFQE